MIGFADKKTISRKGAKKNDTIFCTGTLGNSSIGLELLNLGKKGASVKNHIEPKCRLDISSEIAKYVTSMIDISDGLASEITHLCKESKVGAEIYADKIPISKNAVKDAKIIGKNPLDFALYGGEDFELLFTAPENKAKNLKKLGASAIGKIIGKNKGINLIQNSKKIKLKKGFEHF
jgi:thiamine-monophosphate kinase